jgi:hypothetical protein
VKLVQKLVPRESKWVVGMSLTMPLSGSPVYGNQMLVKQELVKSSSA